MYKSVVTVACVTCSLNLSETRPQYLKAFLVSDCRRAAMSLTPRSRIAAAGNEPEKVQRPSFPRFFRLLDEVQISIDSLCFI